MLKDDVTARHSVLANHGDWVELATGQDIWGADDAPVFHLADWYDSESLALVASAPTLLSDVSDLRSQLATLTAERDAARRERDEERVEFARVTANLHSVIGCKFKEWGEVRAERDRLKATLEAARIRLSTMHGRMIDEGMGVAEGAVQGEPPRCAEWCGKLARSHEHPIGDGEVFQTMDTPARTRCYCSAACRDARGPTQPSGRKRP